MGVQWFDIKPANIGQRTQVVDEKRWSGWLGALTDRRDATRLGRGRIDYVGILRMTAGDGSPIRSPETDWLRFGSTGCMVEFTLDTASRSVVFTNTFACSASSTGSGLDIDSALLGGGASAERPGVDGSRIGSPMIPPAVGYTANIRLNDFGHAPMATVSDRWQAVRGAIFGAGAESVVMSFAGANSAFTVSALRKDLVVDSADAGTSLEALMSAPLDETDEADDFDEVDEP